MRHLFRLFVLTLAFSPAGHSFAGTATPAELTWPVVRRENKPWLRWWWPGAAVDHENLARELSAIAGAGFGGVTVTPVSGAQGAEDRYVPFLSQHYLELLGYAATEAHRLGLSVDMTTGSGAPFGGPQVLPPDAEQKITIQDGKITALPTGFPVQRAAPGGAGLVVNPFSADALQHYLAPYSPVFTDLPPSAIRAQLHDAFAYTATWADGVPAKFLAMHGYNLRDHTAELGGTGDPDTIARLKADYRATLAQLHLDYLQAWITWTHRHGEIAREQADGAPGNLLDLYSVADIPEAVSSGSDSFPIPGFRREPTEAGTDQAQPLLDRFASSAAHVTGRPLVSAEAFQWLREHFHESPSEMKPEIDQLFLAGINHVFLQGACYSPSDAPWPGWLFPASTPLNPRNPLWRELPALTSYVTRCQSLLQSGRPDNDVLVYWPVDDLWHQPEGWTRPLASSNAADWLLPSTCGQACDWLAKHGYAFDLISDAQLNFTHTRGKDLVVPSSLAYRTLIVPRTSHLPLATFQHFLELASDGATIVFLDAPPSDVPGFAKLTERRAQFQAALARLTWSAADADGVQRASLGKGSILLGRLTPALLAPTAAARESAVDQGLGVVRRRLNNGGIYFFANLSAQPVDNWVRLGRAAKAAMLMDPVTDLIGGAALRQPQEGTEIYLQLNPGQSMLVRTFDDLSPPIKSWPYVREAGTPLPVAGTWHVSFIEGGPVLPPAFNLLALQSWTNTGGELERFAGTARYEVEFSLPPDAKADDWRLDLGDVRETARIQVNGVAADHLWSLPFSTRIGAQLRPGPNTLVLEITSLASNRIRDLDRRGMPWKNYHDSTFADIHGLPLDASAWPLQPSGLLGPVRLLPLATLHPGSDGTGTAAQPDQTSIFPPASPTTPHLFAKMSDRERNQVTDAIMRQDLVSILHAWIAAGRAEHDPLKQTVIGSQLWGALRTRPPSPEMYSLMLQFITTSSNATTERGDLIHILGETKTRESLDVLIHAATTLADAGLKQTTLQEIESTGAPWGDGDFHEELSPALEKLWRESQDKILFNAVAVALARIGAPDGIRLLLTSALAADAPSDARKQAAQSALTQVLNPHAVPVLAALLVNPSPTNAASKLASGALAGMTDPSAATVLLNWLQNANKSAAPLARDYVAHTRSPALLKACEAALVPTVNFRSEKNREAIREGLAQNKSGQKTLP